MCEHCGCRGVEPIAELMDEHYALLDDAHRLRRALAAGDREEALLILKRLATNLDLHVNKEEDGIFRALKDQGEYVDEVESLEREHDSFDAAVEALEPDAPDFETRIADLLRDLDDHIERENLGIFPVSVVSLNASGWDQVADARERFPTFLS